MKKNFKKKMEQRHASRRFSERAGVIFTKHTNDLFCSKIKNAGVFGKPQEARHIKSWTETNRCTIWDIIHEGMVHRCVYDKHRKQIVTVKWSKPIKPPEQEIKNVTTCKTGIVSEEFKTEFCSGEVTKASP